MITDEGKYYLYRHIRLDKNEVFYVGIGTKGKKFGIASHYVRANTTERNNSIWKRITNKTNYKVEILLESNDYTFIKSKEREFISLYGRKNLQTGTLANLTNGGEGNQDIICSDELREKRRINAIRLQKEGIISMPRKCIEAARRVNIGKKSSIETIIKLKAVHKKRKDLGLKKAPRLEISNKKQSLTMKKLYQEKGQHENCKKAFFKKGQISQRAIEVLDLENGIYYQSIMEAAYAKGYNRKNLSKKLQGKIQNNTSLTLTKNEL